MGRDELTGKSIQVELGKEVYQTENNYKTSMSISSGGACGAMVLQWLKYFLNNPQSLDEDPMSGKGMYKNVMHNIIKILERQKDYDLHYSNAIAFLKHYRIQHEEPASFPSIDAVLEHLKSPESDGAYYYSIRAQGAQFGHAMGIFKNQKFINFLDPNEGFYTYDRLKNFKIALKSHFAAWHKADPNFDPDHLTNVLYHVTGLIPKDNDAAAARKFPLDLESVTMAIRPKEVSDADFAYLFMLIQWFKKCADPKPFKDSYHSFQNQDLSDIAKMAQIFPKAVKKAVDAKNFTLEHCKINLMAKDKVKLKCIGPMTDDQYKDLEQKLKVHLAKPGRFLIWCDGLLPGGIAHPAKSDDIFGINFTRKMWKIDPDAGNQSLLNFLKDSLRSLGAGKKCDVYRLPDNNT